MSGWSGKTEDKILDLKIAKAAAPAPANAKQSPFALKTKPMTLLVGAFFVALCFVEMAMAAAAILGVGTQTLQTSPTVGGTAVSIPFTLLWEANYDSGLTPAGTLPNMSFSSYGIAIVIIGIVAIAVYVAYLATVWSKDGFYVSLPASAKKRQLSFLVAAGAYFSALLVLLFVCVGPPAANVALAPGTQIVLGTVFEARVVSGAGGTSNDFLLSPTAFGAFAAAMQIVNFFLAAAWLVAFNCRMDFKKKA